MTCKVQTFSFINLIKWTTKFGLTGANIRQRENYNKNLETRSNGRYIYVRYTVCASR